MTTSDILHTATAVIGNVLEWYDFGIYGFFSDTIAETFFPPSTHAGGGEHDPNLLYSYLVFGCAFVARPIGGVVTGHIGDTYGRKRALVFSLFAMSVPTVAMGFLPTYAQVGGWSTASLVVCRVLQGFSVGGQLPSSLVYTLEMKPKEHWGYYGALTNMGSNVGVILANLMGALLRTLLTDDQLADWGWRVAFMSGIFVLPVAIYLRLYGREHNPNEGEYDGNVEGVEVDGGSPPHQTHPLREAVKRENWPALFASVLAPMLYGGGYYISVVWMAIYMEDLIDPPVPGAFWVNLASNCIGLTVTSFVAGWLSDRMGRVRTMTFGAISVGIAGPFMLYIISCGRTVEALFAQTTLCFLLSFYAGPFCTWLVEQFPPKIRLTSVALAFNTGICISSGFTPALATVLVRTSNIAPGFIYSVFAVLGLIGMFISTKFHRDRDVELGDEVPVKERDTQVIFIEDDSSAPLL